MEQPGGQQIPGGVPYGAAPPGGIPQATPRGMMLSNGQPPRPGGSFMPMQQQRPPFPAQMSSPPQPPMNGMPMPPMLGQQRPPSQNFPTQGFAPPPQSNGPPQKLPVNSLQSNFPQQRPQGSGVQQQGQYSQPGFGSGYQNGMQASGPPTPAHIHQQFAQPPGAYNSVSSYPPASAAQGPPSVGSNTPNRGSPLPPGSAGTTTPREPVSAQSSRNPSPLPAPRYDQMEGQFPSTLQLQRMGQSPLPAPQQLQQQPSPIPSQTPQPQPPPPVHQPQPVHPNTISATSQMPPQTYITQSQQMPPRSHMSQPTQIPPGPPRIAQPLSMPPPTSLAQPSKMPPPPSMSQPSQMQPPQMQPPQMQPPQMQPSQMQPPQMQPPQMQPSQMQPPQMQPLQQMPPQQLSEHPGVHQPMQQQINQHPGMPPMPPQASQSRRPPMFQEQQSNMAKRYPNQAGYNQPGYPNNANVDNLTTQIGGMSVTQAGFNKLWGLDSYDLMQMRNILPPEKVEAPKIKLHQNLMESANCSHDIFRCTLTKIPETNSLLQKSRLPLGILIHPFKDLSHLPVVQCNTIVRCRACRTYINPFVYFVDHRRWKCNLCFRVNELPEDFQFDPVTKTFGDPSRRPEIKSSTIEFIAPSEYMLRPPQPAVYLFVLEVSRAAAESGYLRVVCETLVEELDRLPGDARTQIGFITFDSALHFYSLAENLSQPHMMVVGDIDDVFLPCPDNLLVNLHESRDLVRDLLAQLPGKFVGNAETGSALGAALQASFKLMAATGGRVTVFQVTLPSLGPGSLQARGSGNAKDSSPMLNPATDFYKRLALDCSGQQIAVDLFLLNSQYADLASLSGISRYSGGCVQHFPDFNGSSPLHAEGLERSFRRYLTRKIGFEAVMRVRCTRGLAIHTFHGNFFVRSTDLLSLPNVNPDAGFGMQVAIEESLSDMQNVCFQAALLYTSSKGERRIRVHTLCLPICANVNDILNSADQQCIVGLLAKMAVDRSQMSSLNDARDAFINVAVDVLSIYRNTQTAGGPSGLMAPHSLRLLPLYIVAVLKYAAFRSGQSVRVDDRLFAMCQMKSLPLGALMQCIYPDLYPVHYLTDEGALEVEGRIIPQPPRLHLSCEKLDSRGLFLLDTGDKMLMYAGRNIAPSICQAVLGVPSFEAIPDEMLELPELDTPESERLRNLVTYLQTEKPFPPTLQIIREDSKYRSRFIQYLLEDRSESALSYYEFLQHLKSQVK